MSNYFPTTNFLDNNLRDFGTKLVTKDYLISVYPQLGIASPTLFTWGRNNLGQLGNNTTADRSTPGQEFTSSSSWKQVSGGNFHTAAIKTDGTLWCWGYNFYGQIGDNTTANRSTPRQIGTATNWRQVSAGSFHTAAIKTDGTLWAWGLNSYGQVGDNTTANRSTPRQVATATNWKQVDVYDHTVAIKTDGTLWAWGYNSYGQIGDNTSGSVGTPGANSRSTPRQVGTATNWKQVNASAFNTAAIKIDGTLWTWGYNLFGLIGDNTLATRSTPRQEFTASTTWKTVSFSLYSGSAIKSDGTLWTWGRNHFGQLGDNTTDSRSTPRQEFTSSTNWKQVAAGEHGACAIKSDGTLWAWGWNRYGQIGDNTSGSVGTPGANSRSTPTQEFTSSTNWKQISSKSTHIAAIQSLDIT
jgi:alpha-tubulin suppressor-like RCC1 family protein